MLIKGAGEQARNPTARGPLHRPAHCSAFPGVGNRAEKVPVSPSKSVFSDSGRGGGPPGGSAGGRSRSHLGAPQLGVQRAGSGGPGSGTP